MILNLVAILVLLGAVTVVIVLLWGLRGAHASAAGEPVCLACGAPASQLAADSFICPSCGRDVRQNGLAAKPPGVLAQPFWRFVVFTAIVCVVSLFTTGWLQARYRQVNIVANDSEFWGDGAHNYRANLNANLTRSGDHGRTWGELDGELISASGQLLTLQIHCPSMRYEVLDETGRAIAPLSRGAFDEPAVLKWLSAAEMDTSDPLVRGAARRTYLAICNRLEVQPGQLARIDSGMMSGGSTGGYTSSESVPPAITCTCVIAWSIVWLIGSWLILLAAKRRAAIPAAPKGAAV